MYPNENNIQREKWTKINLLFRTEKNSLDNSSCFIFYIHGVSQNILLQSGKKKWETQVGTQHSFDIVFSVLLELESNNVVLPIFRKHFWKPNI